MSEFRDLAGELLKAATQYTEIGELLTASAEKIDELSACLALVKGAIRDLPKGRQR